MNDSADIRVAAEKLNLALRQLEDAVNPMLADLSELRQFKSESENFVEDRAKLAQALDDAKARSAEYEGRESEFRRLADETTAELDQVISKVQNVLERD